MRYGFVFGIGGDAKALERALVTLRDCDRIVSLGNLLGGDEDLAVWERFEALGARGVALAGAGERRRAKDPSFPKELRGRLRGLSSCTLEDGIAILGEPPAPPAGRRESIATGGAPRLVAPLTVTAHGSDSRLWRSAGGLARVSEPPTGATVALGAERFWLQLGRTAAGKPACAVVDLDRATLHLRDPAEAPAFTPAREPQPKVRRARRQDDRQMQLAV